MTCIDPDSFSVRGLLNNNNMTSLIMSECGNSNPKKNQRPLTAKPFVSKIPIHVDQNQIQSMKDRWAVRTRKTASSHQTSKLNEMVPQLPAFAVRDHITTSLYSKFVVKGLKNEKIEIVRNELGKKLGSVPRTLCSSLNNLRSQTNTQAVTHRSTQPNIKREDRESVNPNCNTENYQGRIDGQNNQAIRVKTSTRDHGTISRDFIRELSQSRQLMRSRSAKFPKRANHDQAEAKNKPVLITTTEHKQVPLLKQSNTEKALTRPQTAKKGNLVHQLNWEEEDRNRSSRNSRPCTATPPQKQKVKQHSYQQQVLNQKLCSEKSPTLVLVDQFKFVNFLQRNKKMVSFGKQNTTHLYQKNREPPQQLQKEDGKPGSPHKQVQAEMSEKEQGALKDYELVFQQLVNQRIQVPAIQNLKPKVEVSPAGQPQRLASKDLTDQVEFAQDSQTNERQSKITQQSNHMSDCEEYVDCFEEYIRKCTITQFAIDRNLNKKIEVNDNKTILDCWECQTVIQLGRQLDLVQTQKNTDVDENRQKEIEQQCREIRKAVIKAAQKLSYFRQKSNKDLQQWAQLPFRIVMADEGENITQNESGVQYFYVVLNGSVVREHIARPESVQLKIQQSIPDNNQQLSVFDGQSFGQPLPPQSLLHPERTHFTQISASEPTLLLRANYKDYTDKFLQGSEMQEKLKTLSKVFESELRNRLFLKQDLQMIASCMQSREYRAKSLIFRKGDPWDDLILVKTGKLKIISETVIARHKTAIRDIKQRDERTLKSARRPNKAPFGESSKILKHLGHKEAENRPEEHIPDHVPVFLADPLDLREFHRKSLVNYQSITENDTHVYYYYMNEIGEFIEGDCINWDMVVSELGPAAGETHPQNPHDSSKTNEGSEKHKSAEFSLMAHSQKVQIYTLQRKGFRNLPNELKKIVGRKAVHKLQELKANIKLESEEDIRSWDRYKEKIFQNVLEDKRNQRN